MLSTGLGSSTKLQPEKQECPRHPLPSKNLSGYLELALPSGLARTARAEVEVEGKAPENSIWEEEEVCDFGLGRNGVKQTT